MADGDPIVRLAARAMNTRFEVAVWGRDEPYLIAAAEEAIREIQSLDQQLSFYRDDSDVRELNVFASQRPVTVEPRLFRLLEHAAELSRDTGGAFDPTVGPLLRAWGFTGEGGKVPSDEEVEVARAVIGMERVELDPSRSTVRFQVPGMMLDLGALGKGYAVERGIDILQECEVAGALLHGGTSTMKAIGTQPDGTPWNVAVQDPSDPEGSLGVVPLVDQAFSVSAVHGKYFAEVGPEPGAETARYGHVLDPRSGRPVQGALLAAVRCASATESDALSTALLVLGSPFFPELERLRPGSAALVVERDEAGLQVRRWSL